MPPQEAKVPERKAKVPERYIVMDSQQVFPAAPALLDVPPG
jgi:hypothetical protein